MPGGRGKIQASDNPKPFTSENQPDNRGRKFKVFSQIAQEWKARGIERATPEVVVEAFEYLLGLPYTELKELSTVRGDEESPSLIQIAAEEMTGKRKREILGDMLDRAHGKSTQKQEIGGGLKIDSDSWFSQLPLEKRMEILKIANDAKSNTG